MSRFNLLFIGDVVGEGGVQILEQMLPSLKKKYATDFVIVNGENSHEGRGFNEDICHRLFAAGIDVLTGGDHSFDKHMIIPYLKTERRLLRPLNYPRGVAGLGYGIFESEGGDKIGVINLRGQVFFNNPIECPFRTADWVIPKLKDEVKYSFVDFHAEATAEKLAFAWYVDGRISAMSGTHTHVPTGDEQIFPGGLGYITDAGFTGPHVSVIGMDKDTAINRFLYQTPQKYKSGVEGNRINGVMYELDRETGKTRKIYRVTFPDFIREQ
ncbi:MAG: TIGR00282 family metallophosphoesterase [Sphingobacteriia bacterium]|jgi:hypothetical protein|nr:TIGR00282 family metallophosphoesterase [Sphingobacteriia bacterium]